MKHLLSLARRHLTAAGGQCSECGTWFPDWNGGVCSACKAIGR